MPHLALPDADIWYVQRGSGPDVVWVPGGDNVAEDWELQIAGFEADYRSTAFDPRGAGRTSSRRPPPWSIADMADDCAALIRALCEPPVVVAGLSMGSLVALQMAIAHPELLRGVIPMGTAARPTGFCRDWMVAEVAFRRAGGTLSPDFAVHHYGAFMYPSEVLGDDALWYRLRPFVERSYAGRDPEMLIAQWQACIDFDVEAALTTCRVPIHVIGFDQDMQAPPALGRRVAELAPQGVFHLLEGLGHLSLVGHRTEAVNSLIRRILADLTE